MNIVKILLVLGLGYVALTQKSEKTRNMLLVVTGLLAFCMFSMEGFTIAVNQFDTVFGTAGGGNGLGNPANTVTGTEGARTITGSDGAVYTTTGAINSNPLSGISCVVSAGGATGTPTPVAGNGDGAIIGPHNITELFTCEAAPTGPSNGEQRVSGPEADPCNCLTTVDGKNLYCNSGWMNSEILEYMDSDGKKTDNYEDAHKCWSGTLDFIPKLGDSFVGRCTKKAGSGDCTAPAATGGD